MDITKLLSGLVPAPQTPTEAGRPDQAPTDAAIAAASVARTDTAGDGPDVAPVYEPARQLIDETHRLVVQLAAVVTALADRSPVGADAVTVSQTVGTTPVQLVPAGGGRPRRIIVNNDGATKVYLSPDRREDATGFVVAAGGTVPAAITSDAPVWAVRGSGSGTVVAWVEYAA